MNQNWRPSASIETLKRRAQLLADVRLFFAERNVMEVETPTLSSAAPTAPYLDSFKTDFVPLGSDESVPYYLHTSPEFAMKRLLAAGSGSIYQIATVFRNGEVGRQHQPEFSMLEWYRVGFTLEDLMDEVSTLITTVAEQSEVLRFSYSELFEKYLELDVFTCSEESLSNIAFQNINSLAGTMDLTHDGWLELLMSEVIEPQLAALKQPVLVYDFPASQAQLAKIITDDQDRPVAARFELYAGGFELANGYDELLDANELRARFEQDNHERQLLGKPLMPIDEKLLSAMEAGLPQCSGVALGLERLLMLMTDETSIRAVKMSDF